MIPSAPTSNTKSKTYVYDVLPDGDYPARIVRVIGLGTQAQPDFDGEKKRPAFKCAFTYELIGVKTSGTIITGKGTDEEKSEPMDGRPACQFQDYFLFPGCKRGKVFDLCKVLNPEVQTVPEDFDFFEGVLNEVVNVTVGSYELKRGPNAGSRKNAIRKVSSIPDMFKSQVGEAECEKIFFDPYVDTPKSVHAYSEMYKFQREMLLEAYDSALIPLAGKDPVVNTAEKQKVETKPAKKKEETFSDEADFDETIPF